MPISGVYCPAGTAKKRKENILSEITNLIFKGKEHRLTSPYGKREIIDTKGGSTSSFHSGCDYGTYLKKLPQYAIADGEIISCGKDYANANALYVWVKYPSLGVKMLHYHLDRICVKKGQTVNADTLLGYTGKTGKATGIHLHLGIKRLSEGDYIDAEKWSEEEYPLLKESTEKNNYTKGNYRVTVSALNVRKGPSVTYGKKSFSSLTKNAQSKILALTKGRKVDGYVKGLTFTVLEIKNNWGRTPSGWVCLDYTEKIK